MIVTILFSHKEYDGSYCVAASPNVPPGRPGATSRKRRCLRASGDYSTGFSSAPPTSALTTRSPSSWVTIARRLLVHRVGVVLEYRSPPSMPPSMSLAQPLHLRPTSAAIYSARSGTAFRSVCAITASGYLNQTTSNPHHTARHSRNHYISDPHRRRSAVPAPNRLAAFA